MSSEMQTTTQPLKDVVKSITNDIKTMKETEQFLRKDLDQNVAKTMSLMTKFDTIISKKEDTDKLKQHQISIAESFNQNTNSIKIRLDNVDKEIALLQQKIESFITTQRYENDTYKNQIQVKIDDLKNTIEVQAKALTDKTVLSLQALDDKLSAKIATVEAQTMV